MTPRQLNNLRDFCALKVMRYNRGTCSRLNASEGRTFYSDGMIHKWEDDFGPVSKEFDPTEYASDAMTVLEKCAVKLSYSNGIVIGKHPNKIIWLVESEHDDTSEVMAETLPLAICLFAKQLFSNK